MGAMIAIWLWSQIIRAWKKPPPPQSHCFDWNVCWMCTRSISYDLDNWKVSPDCSSFKKVGARKSWVDQLDPCTIWPLDNWMIVTSGTLDHHHWTLLSLPRKPLTLGRFDIWTYAPEGLELGTSDMSMRWSPWTLGSFESSCAPELLHLSAAGSLPQHRSLCSRVPGFQLRFQISYREL